MKPKLIRITTVPLSIFSLLKGQLRFMSNHYQVKGVSADGELRAEAQENEGVQIIPIEMTRTISPLKDLRSVWKLYLLFRREKPLIVHTHTPKAGTVGMLAAKLGGVPIRLHTVAGLPLMEESGIKRKILDLVERVTYACATRVYTNSLGLYKIILENGFTRTERLKVIGQGSSNGIDTSHFDPSIYPLEQKQNLRDVLKFKKEDYVFIFVGRLVKDKGVNELLEAFRKVSNGKANIKLLLVGYLEPKLDALSKYSLDLIEKNPNIKFAGFQKDVRPFLFAADALVFPSYREGFPNVVMQAGAMGLPSIVSDINGCNEIIVEGKNGTIIPAKNIDALYWAMFRFVEDTGWVGRLKENARQMIVERYEQQVVWEAILAEYKRLEENVQKRP